MTWRVRPPGSHAGEYERALLTIARFREAYEAYLADPGPETRALADHYVIDASNVCNAVGAIPVHAARKKFGVAAVAFLHEGNRSRVGVAETSRPVKVALDKADRLYREMLEKERRKRRNPLRWVGYGLLKAAAFPLRVIISRIESTRDDVIPMYEVVILGIAAVAAAVAVGLTVVAMFA